MEQELKEFLSLITIGDTHIPFELKTYTDSDYEIIEEGTTKLYRDRDTIEIAYSYVSGIDFNRSVR